MSESFEELDRSKVKKKGKKKKKTVNEKDVEDVENEEDRNLSTKTKETNNIKKKNIRYEVTSGESDQENNGDNYDGDKPKGRNVILVNSSEDFNEIDGRKKYSKPKLKKQERSISDNENDDQEETKTSKETINNSRAELFRARSSDMLQQEQSSAESLGANFTKKGGKKKVGKKKKKEKSDGDECKEEENDEENSNSYYSEGSDNKKTKKTKKKKNKEKKNKTEPNNQCQSSNSPSVDNMFAANTAMNGRQSWNSKLPPIRENGHSSKLEPIELRGRKFISLFIYPI